jgi:hypothetical protein
MSTEIRGEQRQAIAAVLVSLVVCGVSSGAEANLIDRASPVAGNLTFALAVYAILIFVMHLSLGLALERPATVRRWQALILLSVTALSAWVLVFLHARPFARSVAALAPGCLLAVLVLGPWHGLLPASKATRKGAGSQGGEK